MANKDRCFKCGAHLLESTPHDLCPKCLMKVGFEEDADAALEESPLIEGPGTKIDHYELLELIGEGGMGLVYLAEQKKPVKRKVALKIVKLGMDTKQVVARFESERQTLAVLEHPNIAHVFDAGTTETGRPYFVMEYVEGKSITKYCDEQKLSVEQRLELFQQVCEGVHHAHQKGIIHRDLKPSNILVCVHGVRATPKIIDFGIAKAITQPLTEKTSYTEHGQLLGTPEYMSPEQAEMAYQDVDTRSDIYSLGVMLYELLAGATPFDAKRLREGGIDQIRRVICEEEPRTPSSRLTSLGDKAKTVAESRRTQIVTLTRRLHRELEWIPMKAMRKDRTRRYRSASELADDIQNYLTGTPLIAGPESSVYRARKFVRKHAGSVAIASLLLVVIILGLVSSILMGCRAEQAREQEVAARVEAEQARDKEVALRAQVEQALLRAENAEKIASESAENYRRGLYVNSIQLADAKYREGYIGNVRKLLESCPEDLRGWEWNRINHVLDQSLMTFDVDKRWVWSVSLSPDGKRLVTGGSESALKVWDITTGKKLTTLPFAHTGSISRVQFSPDGKHIASGDSTGEIKVWDANDVNEAVTSIRHGNSWIRSAAFSPDGERLVSASSGSEEIKVWEIATGAEIRSFGGNPDVLRATFSPDGKQIVSGDQVGVIRILDATSGNELMKLTGHERWVNTVSFSSDGTLLASGSIDSTIKIWNVTTGSLVMTLRGHEGPINSIAFSPDDKRLISGADDCKVMVWNVTTGAEIMTLRGHEGPCHSVTIAQDGKHIVSGSWDGKVKLWDATLDHEVNRFLGHKGMVCSIAFSPDGKRLVSHGQNGQLKVWDVASTTEVMTLKSVGVGRGLVSTAFSPDGKHIASLGVECPVVIWDAQTGAEVTRLGVYKEKARCLAFSPDGQRIVSGSNGGEIKLWDVVKGEEIMAWPGNGYPVLSVAFSPDGQRIVSGHRSGKVWVWDASNGTELVELVGHEGSIFCVAFSPDSKRIASACQEDRTAKIWDTVTGTELMTLRGHGYYLYSLAFSPDGKRLVTGSWDRTARVWDSSTGDELLTLPGDLNVNCVAFSPDGKSIASGTVANTIMLWDIDAPADGYGPRKIAGAARQIVDELHETHDLYHDVIKRLEDDTILDEPVRKAAQQIANSRKVEDAEMLAKEGWEIVNSADKDIDAYKSIVDKAQKVARSEPKTPSILRTLGVGQYRVSAYTEALDTLKNAEKMRAVDSLESDPNSVAFLAMTQYHLGQIDEGRSAINTFRDSFEEIKFVDITSSKHSCWIEAEKVFAGENEKLVAIWDLIGTKELDRAVAMFTKLQPSLKKTDGDFVFSLQGISKYLSRACSARGKSRLLDNDQDYIDRASDYEAAVSTDPNYVSALNDLSWLRTTCTVEEVRDPARAVDLATRACELTDWKNHECLSVLAGACSESEQFAEALKWQQEAIALLSEEDQAEWAGNYSERLRLYQASMPYSAGGLWSFTEGELVSFWDFDDVEDDVVNNRIVGGSQVKLADGGQIVADAERGGVLDLHASKVECTQEPDFDITGAISVGVWIKLRSSMQGWHAIVSKGERGERGWAMSAHVGGLVTMSINVLKHEEYLLGLAKNPFRYLPLGANAEIKDDHWHHVVGTYDGERMCVYVDGELGNSKPIQGNIVTNNGPVVIGDNPEWSGQGYDWSWNGFIDDVRIYSYALSPDEVKMLYEGKEPPQKKGL